MTPNQQGTVYLGDEVLSGVGGQGIDTSGNQVPDLEDHEFLWENPDLNKNTTSRLSTDTAFHLQISTTTEMVQYLTSRF